MKSKMKEKEKVKIKNTFMLKKENICHCVLIFYDLNKHLISQIYKYY